MNKEQIHALIERIKKGDKTELGNLYAEYRKPFLKFASRFNLEREELLDLYQDSVIALMDNIHNGNIDTLESSLKTYLFSIGKFMAFKKLKRLDKMNETALDVDRLDQYVHEIETGNEFDKEEIALFKQSYMKMGKKCQEVLNLYYYRGFSHEEIQEVLGYDNYNVVKSQKSRCLKQLKSLVVNAKNER